MKKTKRKGFNFFRSYYDVYNELETSKDKVDFLDALFARQFHGIEPEELKGMAKFAYISQVNSIDTQVKGYVDRVKAINKNVPNFDPWQGVQKTISTPPQQVQEEGKGEVKQEVKQEEERQSNIDRRKLKFASTIKEFKNEYPDELRKDFYEYWTEPNKSSTKMRFELEKTWSLNRRLDNWAKNDKNFNNGFTKNNQSSQARTTRQQIPDEYD